MLFFWERPNHQFRIGDLLLNVKETRKGFRYMIVFNVRWTTPTGASKPMWVYDGIAVEAYDGEIYTVTGVSCVPEKRLCKVTWSKHNRDLLDPRLLDKAG